MKKHILLFASICSLLYFSSCVSDDPTPLTSIGFEDLELESESAWFNQDRLGEKDSIPGIGSYLTSFQSGTATFPTEFFDYGEFGIGWANFAYANITETNFENLNDQFNNPLGGGSGGSLNYAVFFSREPVKMEFSEIIQVRSMDVINASYAKFDMENGSSFSKKFGGADGNDDDWFLLTITGKDEEGTSTGTVSFYLADYRFEDNSQDYIVDQWTQVDLAALGSVKELEFMLTSSDTGDFGMNTPAYFCFDNIVY